MSPIILLLTFRIATFGRCDYEEVNTISVEMAQLIEFQGQDIILNWGNIFMDRDNYSISREIVTLVFNIDALNYIERKVTKTFKIFNGAFIVTFFVK